VQICPSELNQFDFAIRKLALVEHVDCGRCRSNHVCVNLFPTSTLETHKIDVIEVGKSDEARSHGTPEIRRGFWAFHVETQARVDDGTHGGHDQPGDDVPEERISSRRQAR